MKSESGTVGLRVYILSKSYPQFDDHPQIEYGQGHGDVATFARPGRVVNSNYAQTS